MYVGTLYSMLNLYIISAIVMLDISIILTLGIIDTNALNYTDVYSYILTTTVGLDSILYVTTRQSKEEKNKNNHPQTTHTKKML